MKILRSFLAWPFRFVGLALFALAMIIMTLASVIEGVDRLRSLVMEIVEASNDQKNKRIGEDASSKGASS